MNTALLCSNIDCAAQFLRLLCLFPLNWLSLNGIQIGSFVNMVLMSLALTKRVRVAENKALAAALDAEVKAVELARGMTAQLHDEREKLKVALERQILFATVGSEAVFLYTHSRYGLVLSRPTGRPNQF